LCWIKALSIRDAASEADDCRPEKLARALREVMTDTPAR
jgi:hypothetical protein